MIKIYHTDNKILNNSNFVEDLLKKHKKIRFSRVWRLASKWGSIARHQDGSHYGKDHVDVECTDMSKGHIFHQFWPMAIDYTVWM